MGTLAFFFDEVTLKGSNTYSISEFAQVANLLVRGALEPHAMITRKNSLDKTPDIFVSLSNANNDCKVVINPWQ